MPTRFVKVGLNQQTPAVLAKFDGQWRDTKVFAKRNGFWTPAFESAASGNAMIFPASGTNFLSSGTTGNVSGATDFVISISVWLKFTTISQLQYIFVSRFSDTSFAALYYLPSNRSMRLAGFSSVAGGGVQVLFDERVSNSVPAVNEWVHWCAVFDSRTQNPTPGEKIRLYVNGVRRSPSVSDAPGDPQSHGFFSSQRNHVIGGLSSSDTCFRGKMAFLDVISGVARGPGYFGLTVEGIFKQVLYSGDFGTNGFKLDGLNTFNTTQGKPYGFNVTGSIQLSNADLPIFLG